MTDKSGLYGVIVACFIPGAGGLWKAASLKSDIFNKWQDRADEMRAGLTEGAVRLLLAVQEETIDLLGGPSAGFEPSTFTADPGPLVARVSRFQAAMRARDRLARRLRLLLRVGPALVLIAAFYLVGWGAASVYFVGWNEGAWLRNIGLAISFTAGAAALVVIAFYVHLILRMSSTEVLVHEVSSEGESNRFESSPRPRQGNP